MARSISRQARSGSFIGTAAAAPAKRSGYCATRPASSSLATVASSTVAFGAMCSGGGPARLMICRYPGNWSIIRKRASRFVNPS